MGGVPIRPAACQRTKGEKQGDGENHKNSAQREDQPKPMHMGLHVMPNGEAERPLDSAQYALCAHNNSGAHGAPAYVSRPLQRLLADINHMCLRPNQRKRFPRRGILQRRVG